MRACSSALHTWSSASAHNVRVIPVLKSKIEDSINGASSSQRTGAPALRTDTPWLVIDPHTRVRRIYLRRQAFRAYTQIPPPPHSHRLPPCAQPIAIAPRLVGSEFARVDLPVHCTGQVAAGISLKSQKIAAHSGWHARSAYRRLSVSHASFWSV